MCASRQILARSEDRNAIIRISPLKWAGLDRPHPFVGIAAYFTPASPLKRVFYCPRFDLTERMQKRQRYSAHWLDNAVHLCNYSARRFPAVRCRRWDKTAKPNCTTANGPRYGCWIRASEHRTLLVSLAGSHYRNQVGATGRAES
jgi:hypothetical protein